MSYFIQNNIPEVQRVAVHSHFFVPCPSVTAPEMEFKLQGPKMSVTFVHRNITHPGASSGPQINASHCVNMGDRASCFIIYDVNEDKTGLYTCKAKKMYPPPMENIKEEPSTIVIVEDQQCTPNIPTQSPLSSHLLLSLGLGVLTIYTLIITYIALSLRCRLRKKNLASHDYINMKPRTRRKKQGVLHPTRLSWYRETNTSMAVNKNPPSRRIAY
ncbi:T-cell-specific surface glycoprotein CD28 [Trichomycterus rosablanca]|uniref:T-cell-specific surface glycoprotein CD28 n=1 Tax=Trichomycterus rosablanca TaxID=2290929 RepID=UPI002F3538A2